VGAKKEVVVNIMKSILKTGRFLRLINGEWNLVSEREIRQKIAHAIQYHCRNNSDPQPHQTVQHQLSTSDLSFDIRGLPNALESLPKHSDIQNHDTSFTLLSNLQPLPYNSSDTYHTLTFSEPTEVVPHPTCHNISFCAEDWPWNDASDQLPHCFVPMLHHESQSENMVYYETVHHSSMGSDGPIYDPFDTCLDQWLAQSFSTTPWDHCYDSTLPLPYRQPSDAVLMPASFHNIYNIMPTTGGEEQ
jgi:hypothetical protein